MRKTWTVVVLAILLPVLALTLISCAPDRPRIAVGDVVDFWVAPGVPPEDENFTGVVLYHPPGPLDAVVAAYNHASGVSFNSDTTPSLMARLVLRDGTIIGLAFSSQFPSDRLLVTVASGEMQQGTWYRVKAPGLLAAIWQAAGEHLDLRVLQPESGWLPK